MLCSGPARTLGLLLLAAMTTASTPRVFDPGITYDSTTTFTSQSPMAGSMPALTLVAHGMALADGSSRMDIVTAENAMGTYAAGDYFLTLKGRAVIVHPATKTYVDMMEVSAGALAKMPPDALSQISFTNVTSKLEKVAGDSVIEGRSTTHYRSTVSYSMNMMGQAVPSTIVSDYWLAKLPVQFGNPLAGTQTAAAAGAPDASNPMAEIQKKSAEATPPFTEGTPIRVVMSTTISAQGMNIISTMTTALTNIKEGDVDASKITLPADYTKADK